MTRLQLRQALDHTNKLVELTEQKNAQYPRKEIDYIHRHAKDLSIKLAIKYYERLMPGTKWRVTNE